MMKVLFYFLMLFGISANLLSAERYISKNGHIWFYSKTPLEVIEAHNNQVASVIDPAKNAIAFNVIIKSFKFERALMEEHFNENYMESEKFPKSTFSGQFVGFDPANFKKNGQYNVTIEGNLTIHGVTKKIKQSGTIEVKGNQIIAKSKFNIKPEDYGIAIPALVRDKIAANMQVNVDITYTLSN